MCPQGTCLQKQTRKLLAEQPPSSPDLIDAPQPTAGSALGAQDASFAKWSEWAMTREQPMQERAFVKQYGARSVCDLPLGLTWRTHSATPCEARYVCC